MASVKNQTDLLSELVQLVNCVRDAIDLAAANATPVNAVLIDKCMCEILQIVDLMEDWNANLTEQLLRLAQ